MKSSVFYCIGLIVFTNLLMKPTFRKRWKMADVVVPPVPEAAEPYSAEEGEIVESGGGGGER